MKKLFKSEYELKSFISSMWVFLALNYILCDVLSNMEQSVIAELLTGKVAGMELTQGFLLIAGISLEIPFIMVILTKLLPKKSNRIVNIAAGVLMIVYQVGSFAIGTDASQHYIFFSIVEILGNLAIIMLALKWQYDHAL